MNKNEMIEVPNPDNTSLRVPSVRLEALRFERKTFGLCSGVTFGLAVFTGINSLPILTAGLGALSILSFREFNTSRKEYNKHKQKLINEGRLKIK